jgi:UDP-2-acetamido-2,6-beta-L-arabino-hexul-4-ose reductase
VEGRNRTLTVERQSIAVISDNRGIVFEPVTADDFAALKNAHVVISNPGMVRGNHYHKVGHEIIVVMGPALVRYRDENRLREVKVPDRAVYRFDFPPGIAHALKNTDTKPNLLVAFNTVAHDPDRPDTVPQILIPWE